MLGETEELHAYAGKSKAASPDKAVMLLSHIAALLEDPYTVLYMTDKTRFTSSVGMESRHVFCPGSGVR